jgi:hypothetical protein
MFQSSKVVAAQQRILAVEAEPPVLRWRERNTAMEHELRKHLLPATAFDQTFR